MPVAYVILSDKNSWIVSTTLSDLVAVIEAQEKEVSFVDLTYNERLEHLLLALITERQKAFVYMPLLPGHMQDMFSLHLLVPL